VTGPALFLMRNARFEFPDPVPADARLPVRSVTTNAIGVFPGILNLFPAVFSLSQIILYFIMTGQAHFRGKKIPPNFIHIRRVRVQCLFSDVFMTILTRSLAVGGNMVFPGINKPGGIARGRAPDHEKKR